MGIDRRYRRRQVCRGGIGAMTTLLGVSALTGSARAWSWLDIDIKPGSDPNSINKGATVTVGIFSTQNDIDPTQKIDISQATTRFAIFWGPSHPDDSTLFEKGVAPIHGDGHVGDEDDDGIDDLTFHFEADEDALVGDAHDSDMKGRLLIKEEDGDTWKGEEAVRLVGDW